MSTKAQIRDRQSTSSAGMSFMPSRDLRPHASEQASSPSIGWGRSLAKTSRILLSSRKSPETPYLLTYNCSSPAARFQFAQTGSQPSQKKRRYALLACKLPTLIFPLRNQEAMRHCSFFAMTLLPCCMEACPGSHAISGWI